MQQYNVTGMSCAACSARVEKAVMKVQGVKSCAVSLLTNSMGVEGTASPDEIIAAVEKAGYGASVKGESGVSDAPRADAPFDRETAALRRRLIASICVLIPLMYVSMGHMMWGWPLPDAFARNHLAMGLFELLLTVLVMVINQRFFISGFKSLIHRAPNMDALVALGASASFLWSVYVLFSMSAAVTAGDSAAAEGYMMNFYFESAAMILTLITLGKMLEAHSKGRTTDALLGLMKIAPKTANVIRDGTEVTIPAEQVRAGDIFVVRPGESIPADGIVIDGQSAVNEAALTGESIPVDKMKGDSVSAAAINQSGFIKCEATRVGRDTTLSRIIEMMSEAAATKAPIAKTADRVSGIFVPAVIGVALVTLVIWLLVGQNAGYALARAISVLVISCPCALGLATPVAIMVASGAGAKCGILFKTAESLEETGRVKTVALDKTGTITRGEPVVTDMIPAEGCTKEELLSLAASLEAKSEHPLSKAVMNEARAKNASVRDVRDFRVLQGNGLSAELDGARIAGGSQKFMNDTAEVPEALIRRARELSSDGKTPMLFSRNGAAIGIIAVADTVKDDSQRAVSELKNMGIRVVMLTGDNELTAKAIGAAAGVDEVTAGVLPDGKAQKIRSLKESGKVAMVGDGINDAPALAEADVGIAIGAGADIAADAADVVLMKSTLTDAAAAIRLSRAALRNIHENLFWAFIYNVIGIPIAAGALASFGITLNPMIAAAAMSLSSFCVVSNALRLNLFDPYRIKGAPAAPCKTENGGAASLPSPEVGGAPETRRMVLKIDGMMCEHCERRVKRALLGVSGVVSAEADHEKDIAVIEYEGEIDPDALKSAVEEEDYAVLSME
ncbi:MAG: heavy metal translocating P-type ATPase [Clostridia bacterium]|nr:heavy metal translocating P-type ATPase [Clostridia bacterium]